MEISGARRRRGFTGAASVQARNAGRLRRHQLSSDFPARLSRTSTPHTARLEGVHQHTHTHTHTLSDIHRTGPPPLSLLAFPLQPRHVVRCHRDGGVGAQLPADSAQAGRAGVRLPGALPGRGSRDEPGVGDRRRPVLPVPVGVLLEAGEHRELAVQQHAGLR